MLTLYNHAGVGEDTFWYNVTYQVQLLPDPRCNQTAPMHVQVPRVLYIKKALLLYEFEHDKKLGKEVGGMAHRQR